MQKISFLGSRAPEAQASMHVLRDRFGHVSPEDADVIVALGGDGFMLQTLHAFMDLSTPVYGMNRGSVGFLMNDYAEEDLLERLSDARIATINPLRMIATDAMERRHTGLAINEVALFRQTHQAGKISIAIDGEVLMDELICDGIMAATPAGSTAYNLSANGPILPIRSKLLALTPISAFRPRRWRGALLPWETHLEFTVREQHKRPISATADHLEVRDVTKVQVEAASEIILRLLYNPGHGLEERLLREQFTV
ncbi:MAG: NAD kinase [Pseudomonadota bacterium]